jgi:hypothetical protein
VTGAALPFLPVLLLGIGATLTLDLWALLLRQAFGVAPSNFCLVGRWLRYMPEGTFTHPSISSAPGKSAECAVGWIAHYMIGIAFATAFVAFAGTDWLQHPKPIPAIGFGVVTVMAPFLLMQPAFGLGLAASRTSNPTRARLRTLMNHTVFGAGLYLFGWLASWSL